MAEQSLASLKLRQQIFRRLAFLKQKRWRSAVGVVCFVLLNGYIVYRLYKDWDQIRTIRLLEVNVGFLGITATVQLLGAIAAVFSWMYVLHQCGYRISFLRHFKIYTISNLARKIPGVGWNILGRVYMYEQYGGNKLQISVATLAEMMIFGLSAAIVALITMLLPGGRTEYINPILLSVILTIFVATLPSSIFRGLIQRLNREEKADFNLHWYHLLNWTLFNTITIALGGVTLFFFCRAFNVVDDAAFWALIQGWAIATTSGVLLSWLPGSLGASNSILFIVLSTFMPAPQAAIILIAWRVWFMLAEMAWGGIGFLLP